MSSARRPHDIFHICATNGATCLVYRKWESFLSLENVYICLIPPEFWPLKWNICQSCGRSWPWIWKTLDNCPTVHCRSLLNMYYPLCVLLLLLLLLLRGQETDRQTDRHIDGHGDSMTESAQWGRFSENGSIFGFLLLYRTLRTLKISDRFISFTLSPLRSLQSQEHGCSWSVAVYLCGLPWLV